MRWMWIDRIVELVPRERLVAVKSVSLGEEHLHGYAGAGAVMPGALIVEGMAQSAGILVGHAGGFREKVVLAKVSRATLEREAVAGSTLRYTARLERLDAAGASTRGVVELIEPGASGAAPAREIGRIDLLFSHLDQNAAGREFPAENFVFGESFRAILRMSGFDAV